MIGADQTESDGFVADLKESYVTVYCHCGRCYLYGPLTFGQKPPTDGGWNGWGHSSRGCGPDHDPWFTRTILDAGGWPLRDGADQP